MDKKDDKYFMSWEFVIDAFTPTKAKMEYKTYLASGSNGLTKIGKAIDIKKRLQTLRSANPGIELIAYCDENIEHRLHKEYAQKRVEAEWFLLTDRDIREIIKYNDFKINR